jgi:hypothetical protein
VKQNEEQMPRENVNKTEPYTQSLEDCRDEINHLQNNVKGDVESWIGILSNFRRNRKLPDGHAFKNKCLDGILDCGLSDEEAAYILSFTGGNSRWLNHPYRYGFPIESICRQFYAMNLENVLNKLPEFNNKYLYRMESQTAPVKEELEWFTKKTGSTIHTPYFLSTSLINFNSTEVTWHIKTLDLGSRARDLTRLTNNIKEEEVLFNRNAFFKILSVDSNKGMVELEEQTEIVDSIKLVGNYLSY